MAEAHDRRAVELAKCAADVAYFTHNFLIIDDAQEHGEGTGQMPFHLWPAQCGVLWKFLICRLVIILKARQLGISWLCCAYALWMCLFSPGKRVLIFSKGQREADEMLRRIKVLYDRLPDWMREALPKRTKDNTEVHEWSNGSTVLSFSSNGGRSFTGSLAIVDEAAYIDDLEGVMDAVKPTIDGGGRMIILSTADGLGNLFHRLWTKAVSGINGYVTIFLPWWSRPGRTRDWYNRMVAEETDPEKVKQKYPENANEAFLASGRTRFHSTWIAAQTANIAEPIPRHEWPVPLRPFDDPGKYGDLRIYAPPVRGRRYIIGADVAEGLEDGDYSAATVIDEETWEELAVFHGHLEPDLYAEVLQALGEAYGARIVVERNNHGHAVLLALQKNGFSNIVRGEDGRPGWVTNLKTKPLSIDILAEALRDRLCTVRSQVALNEMQIYQTLGTGKTGAPEGYHDDLVMSWAIALAVLTTRRGRTSAASGPRAASVQIPSIARVPEESPLTTTRKQIVSRSGAAVARTPLSRGMPPFR